MLLPELVIFDMDGLIFDSEALFARELGKVMAQHGYRLTKENYIRTVGTNKAATKRLMLEMYGADYPFDEISNATRDRVNAIAEAGGLSLKPGIHALLRYWKEQGVPCCVASSSPQAYVERYLTLAGIRTYFIRVFGGECAARSKPEPDIFLAACEACAVKPEHALVLEDSEAGVTAALRGGIPVIAIPDLKQPQPELAAQTLLTAADAFAVLNYFAGNTAH